MKTSTFPSSRRDLVRQYPAEQGQEGAWILKRLLPQIANQARLAARLPSALAVFRLMSSSNLVGFSIVDQGDGRDRTSIEHLEPIDPERQFEAS